ncbi:sensor histidine kinase [Paenibacillus sp. GCM10027626]|uniref:cache domain-containing sensor histidine kinase n=1 Tax=Paenibacillus sp. GCM10027626 TaxID=3273411 RepID=UPI00363068A6
MERRVTIFTKIVVIILGLLIPVMILFYFYNENSVQVIKQEVTTLNENKLTFFYKQLNEKVNQIALNSITLSNSPVIEELEYQQISGKLREKQEWEKLVLDDMNQRSGVTGWNTSITLYSRVIQEVISTSPRVIDYDDEALLAEIKEGWQYRQGGRAEYAEPHFVWFTVSPSLAYDQPEKAEMVVKTSFSIGYLQDLLDQYKTDGQGEPLLYNAQHGLIGNRSLDADKAVLINEYFREAALNDSSRMSFSVELADRQYLASYIRLQTLDWYVVDFIPMEEILAPMLTSRQWFYVTTSLLLVLGIAAAYVLYRNVQVPVRALVRHVQRMRLGDYSSRIAMNGGSEFSFLFQRFNDMTEQVQSLLEKVYEERLRSKEAVLKQLQSQINPHFLYNCLFYIKNMARLGDEETVVAMALNLGEYFRYTIRLGEQTAKLQEEMDVIHNYLQIQNMRMKRITYETMIPEEMNRLIIPRLLLQPIVENAVIHGIEPKEGAGIIAIKGIVLEREYRIVIEDDGVGLDEAAMRELNESLDYREEQVRRSMGLWNVNQRLKLTYGKHSGLFLYRVPGGGVRAELIIARQEGEELCFSY